MKTQIGLYKKMMEQGGTTPEININKEILDKIQKEIATLNLSKELMLDFKNQGFQNEEFDYKLCFNENHPENLFVISQIKTFDNNRLVAHKFKVYCYDTNGNKARFNQDKECIDGFYENCYIIKDELL
jgi:hypothetical protein